MLFLLSCNLKTVIHWGGGGGDRILVGWTKLWWEEGEILVGDMSKFLAGWGDSPHPLSRKNSVLITFAPELFWILFYIPKVILKLYLDGKLQGIVAYYLCHKETLVTAKLSDF